MSFDWKDESASEEGREAKSFVSHLPEIWEQARAQITLAQDRQRRYANNEARSTDEEACRSSYWPFLI
jgi:hypothetical protein